MKSPFPEVGVCLIWFVQVAQMGVLARVPDGTCIYLSSFADRRCSWTVAHNLPNKCAGDP